MVLWVLKVLTGRGAGGCARSRRRPHPQAPAPGRCLRAGQPPRLSAIFIR